MFSFTYIFFIFCVDSVTPESLWRYKGVAMHVTHKTMHNISKMHGSPPPDSEHRLQIWALQCVKKYISRHNRI